MIKEFTYTLKTPFEYHNSGELTEAQTLTIKAPTNKVIDHVALIEQEVSKSEFNLITNLKSIYGEDKFEKLSKDATESVKEKKEESEKVTADAILSQMFSNNADMKKCFFALKEILSSGNKEKPVCKVDDTEKFTKPMWEEMTFEDTKELLGEYIVNFITASR